MNKLFLAVICKLVLTLPAAAETSLWVVETGSSVTYLGGTCHLLRPSDYPLPPEFDAAYAAAQAVVFETDPGRLASPEVQQRLALGALYRDGSSLETVLSPQTYRLLEEHCRRSGIPLAALKGLKPAMVVLTLLAAELERLGVTEGGVDFHFYDRAMAGGKRIGELETAGQQVEFLLAMGDGYEDQFIRQSLSDLEKSRELFAELISAWRSGNEAALEKILVAGAKQEHPELYRQLFVARNADWLPRIEALLRSPETELVLVGVGHLVGEDGLLASLRRRGYRVQKLDLAAAPPSR